MKKSNDSDVLILTSEERIELTNKHDRLSQYAKKWKTERREKRREEREDESEDE